MVYHCTSCGCVNAAGTTCNCKNYKLRVNSTTTKIPPKPIANKCKKTGDPHRFATVEIGYYDDYDGSIMGVVSCEDCGDTFGVDGTIDLGAKIE